MTLIARPQNYNFELADPVYQLELIDLQNSIELKDDFNSKTLIECYASLNEQKLKNLRNLAMRMFSLFSSTYICEH